MSNGTKLIIKDNSTQFDLNYVFNCLGSIMINLPNFQNKSLQIQSIDNENLLEKLQSVTQVKKILRFINMIVKEPKKINNLQEDTKSIAKIGKKIYIRPTQDPQQDQKTFWIAKQNIKDKLKLDSPKFVITLPNDYLIAIQRKCISLYQIDGIDIDLKDYDSVGISKKMIPTEMKHINFKQKDYLIIFCNEKQGSKMQFKALIYEIQDTKLRYIKKAYLWNGQVSSPVILFDNYPKNEQEKFCLVVGGYSDNRSSYNYNALQINLYLLTEQYIEITPKNTQKINFNSNCKILSGKAIQFNDYWYIFVSQTQQISQLKLRYQQGGILNQIQIQTQDLNFGQKIYFCQDNLYLGFRGTQHMIIMLNKNLEFRFKPLDQILKKFKYY